MKDIAYVLFTKEQDILRVRQEIEALRAVIPLLADDPPGRIAEDDSTALQKRGNRWPLEISGSR
jgi:hypothetical protein